MIYEYKCESCGEVIEVWQKLSDPAPEACTQCQSKGTLARIISATNFALKGSGWYSTDYKKSSPARVSSEAPAAACGAGGCAVGPCGSGAQA